MGFTTIVSCDNCGKILKGGEDFASISCRFELDRNVMGQADQRRGQSGVYCESCANEIWEKIVEVVVDTPSGIPEPSS